MSQFQWSDYLPSSNSTAILSDNRSVSYVELHHEIELRKQWLLEKNVSVVALDLPNCLEWVLFDMALLSAGIVSVPIPEFFTKSQRQHLLETAGVGLIISEYKSGGIGRITSTNVIAVEADYPARELPDNTSKITFTSGSTGQPKGVCLSLKQQLTTAQVLAEAVAINQPVHLCLLPLATLLENIAGILSPLLAGGTIYLPRSNQLGFSGSRLENPTSLLRQMSNYQPDTLILVPELLSMLVTAAQSGWKPPASLQFIAVGGAKVSEYLITSAQQVGLPVYQGYGLSECGSVVTLNTPTCNTPGSMGKPLPHVRLAIENGELIVSGNIFLGYLGDRSSWYPKSVKTGDLISMSDPHTCWFLGRRKNQIISSFGRNINPEWPESEMLSDGLMQQAILIGDDRPHCVAIVYPFREIDELSLSQWLVMINQRLPDYAQIKQAIVLSKPMSATEGLLTDNGRPNRLNIVQKYHKIIDELYRTDALICPEPLYSPATKSTEVMELVE